MNYNLLKIYAKVADLGSFTQAAKILNLPKSRVSRAIARLEEDIGVQLVRRTTRKTSLTSVGRQFYLSIYPLLNAIDEELTKVRNYQKEMHGTLRITAPEDIGQTLLVKIISAFTAQYPKVEIQTVITNKLLDLTQENIDLSFRAGKLVDSSLIQKKIMCVSFIIVCSKIYLEKHGTPSKIKDLENHKFLSFRGIEKDCFSKEIKIKPTLTSDSIPMLLKMALNGEGITILPDYFCHDYLGSQILLRLFSSWKTKTENIHILYHASKNTSQIIRKFIDVALDHQIVSFNHP